MLVTLGFVRGAHGVRGTLKCAYITDRPETLKSYTWFLLTDEKTGQVVMAISESIVLRGTDFLLRLEGLDNRTDAERYKSWIVSVPVSLVPPRPGGEYFPWQLEGLSVEMKDGRKLGIVKELVFTPANPILDVEGTDGRFYVVFSTEHVLDVDIEAGRLIVADFVGRGCEM